VIVNALMPLIHDRPTGGSVYNRQVLGHLAESMQVELHLDSPAVDRSRWAGGLWLVDSLCLDSGAAHIEQCPDAVAVLIAHYLHVLDPRRQFSRRAAAELEMMKRYRAVVATSRFVDSALPTAGFRGEVEVIPPGLEANYRKPHHRPVRPNPAILTVAGVVPSKGLMELLRGLETSSGLHWRWEIVGDTQLDAAFYREFRECLDRSPVRDRIVMRGALPEPEVAAAYDRCDVFALPSRFETCSMATMEAMARGLPVAAFRVGGLPDLLPEISRQMLAEPDDVSGLMETLRLFLTDAGCRQRLGEANRRASESFLSWEESSFALVRLLRRISPQTE
jgi:glycosyltransferase involved in cell wall biosynthesis